MWPRRYLLQLSGLEIFTMQRFFRRHWMRLLAESPMP